MYKLILIFSLITNACWAISMNPPHDPSIISPEPRPKASRQTLKRAQELIGKYKKAPTTTPQELEKVINYLSFYRSWYQAVTPAPTDSYKQLSEESKKLVDQLKRWGDTFIAEPEKMMPGASRLSEEGQSFYQAVIAALKAGTLPNVSRHSPYAVRLPAHE